LVAFQITDG